MLHKSLGHVSYNRIRKKLGIPIDMPEKCLACAVGKITKSSFKHRSSFASKPFGETHLDLIGPITPISYQHHKYILTIVDSFSRFCAAIPLTSKSDVFQSLTFAIDVEAKRLPYYPSIIHSDRGTEFTNMELENYCKNHIIHQRFSDAYTPQQNGLAERFNRTIEESLKTILRLRKSYWNEVLTVSTLTLNQIPAHKSKKSPYKIFKGALIPIDFFHPLQPQGELGRLIGLNPELKSYRILADNGRIVNTNHVNFLEFSQDHQNMEHDNSDELVISENQDKVEAKTEEEDDMEKTVEDFPYETADEDDSSENEEIEEILIPQPAPLAGRTLCERTIQVKPVKYSHLTVEPMASSAQASALDLGIQDQTCH
ncbi:hypothetical protein VP01_5816g1 [Puccinia sorghi]|uniref:Integrase catalytic domain-containing protein n=1 Tax=Puccinia sorghi TaxID=27349 RepID=A0A0L6UI56_9BASI|nr:hypothetical protein VP01_5816g1 [Puccinia sorghi]